MAATSFFPIGCMIWQHAVILESIWETDLTLTRFLASRTGLLTPRLTCFTLPTPFLPFSLGQKISKSNFSSLLFLDENILSPTPILQNYSKTISNSVLVAKTIQFCKNILSPTPILQNYSKTISNSVLVAKTNQFCKNILSSIPFLTKKNFLFLLRIKYSCHRSLNGVH